jgi:hypothetical protein
LTELTELTELAELAELAELTELAEFVLSSLSLSFFPSILSLVTRHPLLPLPSKTELVIVINNNQLSLIKFFTLPKT